MATLDLAGIITRVCTDLKEKFASKSVETSKQDKLVSGMNIKTINNASLLSSGNITVATSDQVGYELRAAHAQMCASDGCGYRRMFFTSADGTKMVPINTSQSSSSSDAKTLNTRPIDPFGRIVYFMNPAYVNSTLNPNAQWDQYLLTIGYSYVITLTSYNPVYLKCTPQSDGSAVMVDIVQALPSTNDGYIYIFLGVAYTTTSMELLMHHPVYYHDGTGIRLWTGAGSGGGSGAYTPDEYPMANISSQGGDTQAQLYAFGGTATLMCGNDTTPSGTWGTKTLCTIPSGYRPPQTLYFPVNKTGAAQSDSYIMVDSSTGVVTLQNWGGSQTSVNYFGTCTWAYHSSGLSAANGVNF